MDHFEEEGAYQLEGVGEYYWNYIDSTMNRYCMENNDPVEHPSSVYHNTPLGTGTSQNHSPFVNPSEVTREKPANRQPIKTKYEMRQQKRKERYQQLPPKDRYLFNYRNRYHVDSRKTKLTKEEEGRIKMVKTRNAMDTWQRRQKKKLGEQEDSEQSGKEEEKGMGSSELSDENLENDHSALESDEPKTLNDLLILKNAKDPNGADPYFCRKLKHPPLTPQERRLKHDEQRRKKYRESKTEVYAPREARLQESETARRAAAQIMKDKGRRVNEQDSNPASHEQTTWDPH